MSMPKLAISRWTVRLRTQHRDRTPVGAEERSDEGSAVQPVAAEGAERELQRDDEDFGLAYSSCMYLLAHCLLQFVLACRGLQCDAGNIAGKLASPSCCRPPRGQSVVLFRPRRRVRRPITFHPSTLPPPASEHKLPPHLDTLTISGELRGNSIVNMEPQSMRQKVGGDEKEATEIIAFGGPMYDEATARKILQAAVLIPAKYAEDGEAVIGFDPDDAALDHLYFVDNEDFDAVRITPMTYFVQREDVKMCRYLISRGASTTKSWEEDDSLCPMWYAAQDGNLEICNVLYANGAQNDVRNADEDGWTPFHFAAVNRRDDMVRWLVLHGALCADDDSEEIEKDRIYLQLHFLWEKSEGIEWDRRYLEAYWSNNSQISRSCKRLVKWANKVTQSHSALVMFLLGALPPAPDAKQSRILQCLSGHPGVRKHIGDFVGLEVTKGKHLRRTKCSGCDAFLNQKLMVCRA